jgi:protein O-mannosyl-transferase
MKLTKSEKKRLRKERRRQKLEEKQYTSNEEQIQISSFSDVKNLLRSNGLFVFLLFLLVFTVYFYNLSADFVSADDLAGYVNNPEIRNLSETIKTARLGLIYYSVMYLTFGANPFPLHLVSLLLHAVAVILVFVFAYITFGKRIAAVSSILFAVHPVTAEAVSWISGHAYLSSAVIIFSSLITYYIYRNSGKYIYLIVSVGIFIFGAVFIRTGWIISTLPFILAALELGVFKTRLTKKTITQLAPYFALSASFVAFYFYQAFFTRLQDLQTVYGLNPEQATPWLNRVPYTIYMTFKLLVFPKDLSFFHEGQIISTPLYIFMIFTTVSVFLSIILLWKKQRIIAGLLLIVVFSVLPTLSPVQISFFIAERYMYVGTAFFCILIAVLIFKAEKKIPAKNFVIITAAVLTLLFSVRTAIRTVDWHNSKNLWLATSKTAPYSPRVYNNLGDAYANENNFEMSVQAFQTAILLNPEYVDAIHNLGNIYLQTGHFDLAREQFEKALELNPEYEGATMAKEILQALSEQSR